MNRLQIKASYCLRSTRKLAEMSLPREHPFLKMNGLGNEIAVLDLRGSPDRVNGEAARQAAEGPASFDQLMVLYDPRMAGTDAFVAIFNRDGSEAAACGNGARCVAYALLRGGNRDRLHLETMAGLLSCERHGPLSFSVDMGKPRLRWDEIPLRERFVDTRTIELQIGPIDAPVLHSPSVVNMGNPHAIFWVARGADFDLERIGPMLENHPIFPNRANISLAEVRSRDHLRVRVWERGAGLTKACGSAACAALVAAVRKDYCERAATVSLPGGDLRVEWRQSDDHVILTGPVELEFEGTLNLAPSVRVLT
jgi:diaminopimelate epimerase